MSLLEQNNRTRQFMLHLQQRLIEIWDVEAELTFEDDERLELMYSYDPSDDEDGRITVSISCNIDGDNVLIGVDSKTFIGDDQVDLDINLVIANVSSLTNRAEATH